MILYNYDSDYDYDFIELEEDPWIRQDALIKAHLGVYSRGRVLNEVAHGHEVHVAHHVLSAAQDVTALSRVGRSIFAAPGAM